MDWLIANLGTIVVGLIVAANPPAAAAAQTAQ